MDGPGKLFQLEESDDLVYFGKGSDRNAKVCLTRAVWNGAATGTGVFKLIVEGTKGSVGFMSYTFLNSLAVLVSRILS